MWDVTKKTILLIARKKFLLTHPVWDVTAKEMAEYFTDKISTHTSRVGCDFLVFERSRQWQISTHTSRVGCDRYI